MYKEIIKAPCFNYDAPEEDAGFPTASDKCSILKYGNFEYVGLVELSLDMISCKYRKNIQLCHYA